MSDTAAIGHNNPPPPTTADEWTAFLTERFAPQQARKDQLLAAYDRFLVAYQQIEDAETAKRAADFIAQLKDLEKMAGAIHTQEKAPVLLASRAIDGFLRDFNQPLTNAAAVIRDRNTAYLRRKEDAIRQQRQNRRIDRCLGRVGVDEFNECVRRADGLQQTLERELVELVQGRGVGPGSAEHRVEVDAGLHEVSRQQ